MKTGICIIKKHPSITQGQVDMLQFKPGGCRVIANRSQWHIGWLQVQRKSRWVESRIVGRKNCMEMCHKSAFITCSSHITAISNGVTHNIESELTDAFQNLSEGNKWNLLGTGNACYLLTVLLYKAKPLFNQYVCRHAVTQRWKNASTPVQHHCAQ
ncbi:hypothetical protein [Saezia sanguinis]|uniref:hypothetical protein n=1 Tax=Saezia sanguinis TaxID=1965230 RepID=UPI001EF6C8FF|nr:hypothetical protein [Saezia sanguinis]